jgi:hypothetical protein
MSGVRETLLFKMSYRYIAGGEKTGVISKERQIPS